MGLLDLCDKWNVIAKVKFAEVYFDYYCVTLKRGIYKYYQDLASI